jgi:hypothetical protein
MKPVIGTAVAVVFIVFLAVPKEEPPGDRTPEKSMGAQLESSSSRPRSSLWGFVDREGNVVIEPKFTSVSRFHEGLAFVKVGGIIPDDEVSLTIDPRDKRTWGVIDRTGKMVVAPKFDQAFHFQEGTAPVQVDGKWGFIDRRGEYVIEPRFDQVFHFYEGLAKAKRDEKWGFIDREGDFAVEPVYDGAGHFSEGLANVAVRDPEEGNLVWGYVDRSGKVVIEPKCHGAGEFSEGYAAVRSEDGLKGYIDREGNQMIPFRFRSGDPFRNGLARARLSTKPPMAGMIDKSGTMVIESVRHYSDLGISPDGAITAYYYHPKTHEKIGVPFNPADIWPFPGLYYSEMYFREGRTTIQIEGSDPPRYAVVDQNGDIVFTTDPEKIRDLGDYREGLAHFGIR